MVLASTFHKLQKEFKDALINVLKNDANIVIGGDGELLDSYGSKAIEASVKLLGDFLQRIQSSNLSTVEAPNEYILLKKSPDELYEHGRWINGEYLEKIAGSSLNFDALRSSELRTKPEKEQISLVAGMSGQFVAVPNDEHRFEYLIDRQLLLEKCAIKALTATESISDPKKKAMSTSN
jgi:hypothetical protein